MKKAADATKRLEARVATDECYQELYGDLNEDDPQSSHPTRQFFGDSDDEGGFLGAPLSLVSLVGPSSPGGARVSTMSESLDFDFNNELDQEAHEPPLEVETPPVPPATSDAGCSSP
eukprot:4361106-Pyramimonas_sp.AAC.1